MLGVKVTGAPFISTFLIQPMYGVLAVIPLTFFRNRCPPKKRVLPVSVDVKKAAPALGSPWKLSTERDTTFLDFTAKTENYIIP